MKIKTFEDLDIWNKAIDLYVEIFFISEGGSLKRDFSAKDQIKRATLSISNNIAEGFEYENNKDFLRFLKFSKGSAGEVRSMVHAFYRTQQITQEQHDKLLPTIIEISKNLKGFMKYLRSSKKPEKK